MYVPSSTLAPYYRRTTAPATRRHRGAMRGLLLARHRRRPTPAVVPWRVSAEAALAPQSRRRRRFVVVAGVASLAAVAAVVVAVGLETVVNVVVQLGSAGHTAAAACGAPSISLLPRAPRRPYRCSHSVESKKTAVTAQQQLGHYATAAAPSPLPAS